MERARVIVNPVAGAGKTAKLWPEIHHLLEKRGLQFDYDLTEAPGHAVELAVIAARKGYRSVITVGGDGTIHEVVNGLYSSGNIKDMSLGIIGTGTGGDYIRTLGLPRNPRLACERLTNDSKKISADLGIVEYSEGAHKKQKVFVNFGGTGFDAEVVRATTKKYKKLGGMPSYLAGLLTTLISYRNRGITIKYDHKAENRRVCTVIVSNGRYGGGSMFIAPEADIHDGLFDVIIIGDVSKPDLLVSLPRVYKGTHLTHPKITLIRTSELEIESGADLALQADGELLGNLPARFKVLPSVLNIQV